MSARRAAGRAAALLLLLATGAAAHPLAPSLFEVREGAGGHVEVTWKTSLLQPRGADLRPELPPHCAATGEPVVERDATSVTLRFDAECGDGGLVGHRLRVVGLGETRTDALVRVALADGRRLRAVLSGADAVFAIEPRQSAAGVAADYVGLGFEHILGGPDHLLFVLGLLLLVAGRRRLLLTVTAFTLGHSVTLSLAVLGFVSFPSAWVELLIAVSILVLAVDLARPAGAPPTQLRRRPWQLAFAFGLLHGLGFAGALAEVGLPPEEIPLSLLSFNVGIELGQVTFIACVMLLRALLYRVHPREPRWFAPVTTYAIGSLAVFWCLERLQTILR